MDAAYGFVVWGQVLNGELARYPQFYRQASDMSGFPLMFVGILGALLSLVFWSSLAGPGYFTRSRRTTVEGPGGSRTVREERSNL